jgi:hypothetical protein
MRFLREGVQKKDIDTGSRTVLWAARAATFGQDGGAGPAAGTRMTAGIGTAIERAEGWPGGMVTGAGAATGAAMDPGIGTAADPGIGTVVDANRAINRGFLWLGGPSNRFVS